ncbi:hypothetical protein MMC29_003503 [Sticta canariensis]|nr:hypothetical protein [Sticta canariensis]
MTNFDFEKNAQSLAARSLTCKELLKKLCHSQDDQQWAKDQAAQFNIWAADTGVFAETHYSLDFRLEGIPETRNLVALLLHTLEVDLIHSQTPLDEVHQHDNPRSSEIDETNDDSSISEYDFLSSSEEIEAVAPIAPLSESCVAIQETIDRLNRLAAMIRRSGKKHRQLRIERYLDKPSNLEVHQRIKMLALWKVEYFFPQASEALRERMAESIAKRRSRFFYIKQHQRKTSTPNYPQPAPQAPVDYEEAHALPQSPDPDNELPVLIRPQIFEPFVVSSTILSGTEVTKLDQNLLRAIREDRPETVASAYLSLSGFPNPPKVCSTETSFLCPYCCLERPMKEARGELWKQHVIRDFEPFFCVFDDCKHPFESSDSFSAWITHVQEHMPLQWHCTAPIHETMVFSEKERFEEHMRTHYDHLTDPLLSTLTKHSERHRIFQSCPFCGGLPEELEREFPNQQDPEAQQAFQRHLKEHLVAVALILPPIRVDLHEEEGRSSGSSAQGDAENAFDSDKEAIIPLTYCERGDQEKPCDCRNGKRDSTTEWLTMAGIVMPIWGELKSMRSLEHFYDPGWPLDPRFALSDPEYWGLPIERQQHRSVIKGGWEQCGNLSLPPVQKDISTNYKGHLKDDKLVPFVKRYEELKAKDKLKKYETLPHESLPYGIKVLAEGVDSAIDIVAVHGLNGHRQKTWTAANDVNWLCDFLPSDIPNARILTWGYDANTHSTPRHLSDHAKTLVSDLCLMRRLTESQMRPILFVAHSLGGLVVKSALIHSDSIRQGALEEHRSIKLSTYGIFFMGTPHEGGIGAHFGERMLRLTSIFATPDDKILKHLDRDSEWLQQQLSQFGLISRDFVIRFAYEMYPTPVALGKATMVVPDASAIIPGVADAESVAIAADHLNMIKFTSREDSGYEKVLGQLQLMAQEAPDAVEARWAEQTRMSEALFGNQFSVPFSLSGVPETELFIGREEEIDMVKAAFRGGASCRRIVTLQGLGGVGKTQLAVTFVKQQRDAFSAVFWLNGGNEEVLKQCFANMAQRLYDQYPSSKLKKIAAESKNPDEVVEMMKLWLSAKDNIQWMLVFDNVDDPQAYDIRSYFPEADQGFILITTRSSQLRIGKVISVKNLQNINESIAILAQMSQRQISDQDPHVVELVKQLDGLPLALATAGVYLSQVSSSLADYLHYYRTSWLRLQETSPQLYSYQDRALYSTWNTSYERIHSQNESAAKLLQLWAYFDNKDIWYALLAGGREYSPDWFLNVTQDELSFYKAIRLLRDHSLVESHGVSGGYCMHSCVHAWTKHVLKSEKDHIPMTKLALNCIGSAVPDETVTEYWLLQRRLLPHANRCLEFFGNDSILDSENDHYILNAIRNLGALYLDQGKMKEAEEMYLRALTGYEKAWGAEHASILDLVKNLGILYSDQGKRNEVEEMYLRALPGKEKAWGAEHTSMLDKVNNLGLLYSRQGKMEEAEGMYLRALTGKEKTWGAEHTSTLDTVNNLGLLYSRQGKMEEAEGMYLRALTGKEKAWGPEHTSTLDTVNNLGLLYSRQGKMKEAEEMYLRALTGKEKAWGPEHTSTLDTVNNLGLLYSRQGKMEEAEGMYLRALTGKKKA